MINIVGGVYNESCLEPFFKETYGSGLRAVRVMLSLDPALELTFDTFLQKKLVSYVESFQEVYKRFYLNHHLIEENISFYYDYPLSFPHIFPRLDTIKKDQNHIKIEAENILVYGLIEGSFNVKGSKVVYDPQSPINPKSFIETGSSAEELAIVLNWGEAKLLSGTDSLENIKKYFFSVEKVDVLILKRGAKGANVYNKNGEELNVPVYKTENVWNIGSGDVFASTFAFYWFNGESEFLAAKKASYATAEYCNLRDYQFTRFESNIVVIPFSIVTEPKGQIYLAGPFFTFSQRWLIDRIRRDLLEMGLKVFSPFHDVGFGNSKEVANKDLMALEESSVVFAVLDGLDAGTLFETGYAAALKIPIISYVQNESKDSLLMLDGADCQYVDDLTTAIYKTYWKAAENG